ncbi:hypothetical protein Sulku_1334 [Sulfuricurvum kujiense DSM 16994]|uniref:Replication initiation factor n=1 Tax=Sulfuricurvum kujiense (strain ATCC BAA-921 / DSM 16994 / JCM 11577 / YK-1) TaxID=709032 RepID=E4TY77_SULKY|nr:hypothetical protein [Sulfuricurvum kujiense]ADR33997.1 hypothetical protein Sulku_1334 [Sulfuricurvum kujiense DSM 16994]
MTLISQHTDTFKEALYLSGDYEKYNKFVNDMIELKEQAQDIHDINNDNRFIVFTMGGMKWHIMATSIRGYSVVLKNGDVSIALKKKGDLKTDKNPSVKIEYRASFLVNYGLNSCVKTMHDYFKVFIHADFISKVQEIHISADTQGHRFSLLDIVRFKTRSRFISVHDGDDEFIGRQMVFSSRRMETMYFGGSNNKLRIYDKTKEIKGHPDSGHIERLWRLNPLYNEQKDVWRIEFQIRRPILKQLFNAHKEPYDYTSVLLENISGLWDFFINYFSYRDLDRDKTLNIIEGHWQKKDGSFKILTKEAERNIYKKSELHPLWKLISSYEATKPSYYFRFNQVKATSPIYAMNAYCALVSTITKHYGRFDEELVKKTIVEAETRCEKNNDMGVLDKAILKTVDYFAKVDYQKSNGLDIIDVDDAVKENIEYYIAPLASHTVENALHKTIF